MQAADWQRIGYGPRMLSVKLRNAVLRDPAFPARLQQVLDKAGLATELTFMKAAGCDEYVASLLGLALLAPDFEERWLRPTSSLS